MAYKYFIYSINQMKFMKDMQKKMGRTYRPGIVFNKGRKFSFTELSSTGKSIYSDAKIVAEGEVNKFKYTMPTK